MASQFAQPKSKPQKAALKQKLVYSLNEFDGVNTTDDPVSVAPAQSPDTLNTVLDSIGALLPRQGYTKLLTTKLSAQTLGGFAYYRSTGVKQLVYAEGLNWYAYNNVGGSTQLNIASFNPSTPLDFDMYNDVMYGVDGNDFIQYNGSTCGIVGGISGVFTQPTNIKVHKNRGWIAQGSTIYFSNAGDMTTWPANNYLQVNTNDGQNITGLGVLNDALVVFKSDSVWYIKGEPLGAGTNTTIGNLSLVQVNSSVGCVAFRTIRNVESIILFMARDGIYALQNNTVQLVSDPINGTFQNDMNNSAQSLAWGVYNANEKKYLVGYASAASATPNKAICYDLILKRFLIWDDFPGSWACNFRFNQIDSTVMGDANQGNIYELFQGYADIAGYNGTVTGSSSTTLVDSTAAWATNQFVDAKVYVGLGTALVYSGVITANSATTLTVSSWTNGTPPTLLNYSIGAYNAYWKSKVFDFDDPAMRKRYKYYNVFADTEGPYFLQNGVSIDFGVLSYNLPPISLASGGVTWDEAGITWDESGIFWDVAATVYAQQGLPGQGHFIQVIFGSFNSNQPWRVFEHSFTYKLKRESPN